MKVKKQRRGGGGEKMILMTNTMDRERGRDNKLKNVVGMRMWSFNKQNYI